MKQYQVVKSVYADSIRQAIEKEKEGVIMNVTYFDEFTEEDYQSILKNRNKFKSQIK